MMPSIKLNRFSDISSFSKEGTSGHISPPSAASEGKIRHFQQHLPPQGPTSDNNKASTD